MLKYYKRIAFFFVFLVLISLVSALPPFQETQETTETDKFLTIVYPQNTIYKSKTKIAIPFDVLDSNNSRLDNNSVTCEFFIVDDEGYGRLSINLSYHQSNKYWNVTIDETVFNETGIYSNYVHCHASSINENGFVSYIFTVTSNGNPKIDNPIVPAIIVLLPMILSFIFLIGAVSLKETEHAILKTFLFLFSFIPFIVSLHFGAITLVAYYDMPELQEAMGVTVNWFVWLFFFGIVAYFILYFIYVLFRGMQEKKRIRMEY